MPEYSINIKKFKGEAVSKHRIYHPHVPPVTNENDGKFLKSADGKARFEGSVGFVNFTLDPEGYDNTCDKTVSEIIEMSKNGPVIGVCKFVEESGEYEEYYNYATCTHDSLVGTACNFISVSLSGTTPYDFTIKSLVVTEYGVIRNYGSEEVHAIPPYTKEDAGKVLMIGEDGIPAWTTPSTT